MGAKMSSVKSSNKSYSNMYEILDHIASDFILTLNYKSYQNLTQPEYCDKVILLTSDIINKQFEHIQVEYVTDRINGKSTKDKVHYAMKQNIDPEKKRAMCMGLARYYISIAQIYAAIVMTINPVFSYTDSATGQHKTVGFMQKDTIPSTAITKIHKWNLCDNRIRALMKGIDYDKDGNLSDAEKAKSVHTIHPTICGLNTTINRLIDEPGIKELDKLYYDVYDPKTGAFTSMSPESKAYYEKDLRIFYTSFTGQAQMPDTIRSFSDIMLRDFSHSMGCTNGTFNQSYDLKSSDALFIDYTENIKKSVQHSNQNQTRLLEVINEIFYMHSESSQISINPSLTLSKLNTLITKTRKMLINFYIACEEDFLNGLKIFEAIVSAKVVQNTKMQLQNLTNIQTTNIAQGNKLLFNPQQPQQQQPTGVGNQHPNQQPNGVGNHQHIQHPNQQPNRFGNPQHNQQPNEVGNPQHNQHPNQQPNRVGNPQHIQHPNQPPTGVGNPQHIQHPNQPPNQQQIIQPIQPPTQLPTVQPNQPPNQPPPQQQIIQPTQPPTVQPNQPPPQQQIIQPTQPPTVQPNQSPNQPPNQPPNQSPTQPPTVQPNQPPIVQPNQPPTQQRDGVNIPPIQSPISHNSQSISEPSTSISTLSHEIFSTPVQSSRSSLTDDEYKTAPIGPISPISSISDSNFGTPSQGSLTTVGSTMNQGSSSITIKPAENPSPWSNTHVFVPPSIY